MDDFRSSSYREVGMRMENYYGGKSSLSAAAAPTSMQELRCYSASYAYTDQLPNHVGKEIKIKKSKSSFGSSSSLKGWSFNDPELQRKKRVAGYKVYEVEAKMKGSLRKSFRWIKNTLGYGWK